MMLPLVLGLNCYNPAIQAKKILRLLKLPFIRVHLLSRQRGKVFFSAAADETFTRYDVIDFTVLVIQGTV